ncbi:MAG: ABC transporter ATP-binding protein [Clostridia bacterium]
MSRMQARFAQSNPNEASKKTQRPKSPWKTMVKIWRYLAKHRRLLVLVFLMVLLYSVLVLLGPYFVGVAIDQYLSDVSSKGLITLLVLLAAIYVLHSVSLWMQNYWMIGVAQKTVCEMRSELFRHVLRLPVSYFAKRQHGEVMSRLTNDIDNVSSTLNSSFIQIVSSLFTLVGMASMMIWMSPLLTVVTLLVIPLMFLGMKWITNRTGKFFKEQQKNLGDINGFVEETLSGQKIVKSFSQEQNVIEQFQCKNERLKTSGYWAQTYSGFIPKLMNVLNNASFALIAGVGGVMAVNGMITVGVIVTFSEYARQFIRPLHDLSNQFNTFLSAVAGAERVFEVLEEAVESQDEVDAIHLGSIRGEIQFCNVSFSYDPNGQQTLKSIEFHVSPGQTLALVGPTGAGKTTIVQLLTRFYDADSGHIFVDGHDIKTIARASLRRQMGFVLQDAFLFRGTVKDNIRYGKLAASDQEVVEAAKLANAHSFIMALPNQYDTVLDGNGSGISQGQKQLLSIARAILADPSILILDEATSSIDTITEIKIQEALYRLMQGRTSFVIAHRLNTIRQADVILVLEDGSLIEQGSHHELLKQKGLYYGLVSSQYTDASAAVGNS